MDSMKASIKGELSTMSKESTIRVCKAFGPNIKAMVMSEGPTLSIK